MTMTMTIAMTMASGCAAQHEEAMPREADRSADYEAAEPSSDALMDAEPAAEAMDGELDLDHMQRELAANEAKLRALGVVLPGPADQLREDAGALPNEPRGGEAKSSTASSEAGRDQAPAPPSAAPGDSNKDSNKDSKRKGSRREHEHRTLEPHHAPDMEPARPDPAKAAPLSPNTDPREQDAAGRCLQICELSTITCELNTAICELADRHDAEQDYRVACERAAEDCELAQEACDACVG